MTGYPQALTSVGHLEPVPRRIRAQLAGRTVLDTVAAVYRWDISYYPHYYIPLDDFAPDVLGLLGLPPDPTETGETSWQQDLVVDDLRRPGALSVCSSLSARYPGAYAMIAWDAVDAWFEEDEQVYVHPRNPYQRVDALRSHRGLVVAVDGLVLAETQTPVLVFETSLPTRYYVDPTDVRWKHLVRSETQTACPYKGTTTGYWSAVTNGRTHADLAWCYRYPTAPLLPIAGLIAFYNEKVDITLDGRPLERPVTQFS